MSLSSNPSHSELEAMLERSEEEILAELGRQVIEPGLGALPATPARLVAVGKAWIDKHRRTACHALQKRREVVAFVNGGSAYRRVEIVAIVADCLTLLYKPAAGWWGAVALVKAGLPEVCQWTIPVNVLADSEDGHPHQQGERSV